MDLLSAGPAGRSTVSPASVPGEFQLPVFQRVAVVEVNPQGGRRTFLEGVTVQGAAAAGGQPDLDLGIFQPNFVVAWRGSFAIV